MKICPYCGNIFSSDSLSATINSCPILYCSGPLIDAKGDDFERAVQILNYKGYKTELIYPADTIGDEFIILFDKILHGKAFPTCPDKFMSSLSTDGNIILTKSLSANSPSERLRLLNEAKQDLYNWAKSLLKLRGMIIRIDENYNLDCDEIKFFAQKAHHLLNGVIVSGYTRYEYVVYNILIHPNAFDEFASSIVSNFDIEGVTVTIYENI